MKFISEKIIENIAGEIGQSEANFKNATIELHQEQPTITAFIFSENFDLFTQAEKELLLFLVLVIFKSIQHEKGKIENPSTELLGKHEEKNWELLSGVTAKKFRERIDIFFENYFQEDLLAFVEDALTEDEEEIVTKIGREPLFIALKSIIDCWCDSTTK